MLLQLGTSTHLDNELCIVTIKNEYGYSRCTVYRQLYMSSYYRISKTQHRKPLKKMWWKHLLHPATESWKRSPGKVKCLRAREFGLKETLHKMEMIRRWFTKLFRSQTSWMVTMFIFNIEYVHFCSFLELTPSFSSATHFYTLMCYSIYLATSAVSKHQNRLWEFMSPWYDIHDPQSSA